VARYHAPGRINLIGEHTDYAGGLVLPVAIDRGLTVTCEPAERIRLRSDAAPGLVELDADGGGAADGFGRYVAAVAAELAALGRRPVGVEGEIGGDLPARAGLSSSAALLVAMCLRRGVSPATPRRRSTLGSCSSGLAPAGYSHITSMLPSAGSS